MSRLEKIEPETWREFVAAPVSVLMLGKSDCAQCAQWTEELEQFLAGDEEFARVRFGKVLLDQRGFTDLKREQRWIADVDALPFNQIFVNGERSKAFAGGGIERLKTRLRSLGG